MLPEASRRLADDHSALDEVLSGLSKALDTADVDASHARLDLFWAQLAIHIRAEHLHLFPAIIKGLSKTPDDQAVAPTRNEGQQAIERLRGDHDFFMHELARAIGILRELVHNKDLRTVDEGMRVVREAVLEVQNRLIIHNELEESQVYRWAKTILNEEEQAELATRISVELANLPPRFSQTPQSIQ